MWKVKSKIKIKKKHYCSKFEHISSNIFLQYICSATFLIDLHLTYNFFLNTIFIWITSFFTKTRGFKLFMVKQYRLLNKIKIENLHFFSQIHVYLYLTKALILTCKFQYKHTPLYLAYSCAIIIKSLTNTIPFKIQLQNLPFNAHHYGQLLQQ